MLQYIFIQREGEPIFDMLKLIHFHSVSSVIIEIMQTEAIKIQDPNSDAQAPKVAKMR